MNTRQRGRSSRNLRPGDELSASDRLGIWRVSCGIVGVSNTTTDDEPVHYLAVPGDLVGAELLAGDATPPFAFAVTAVQLEAVACPGEKTRHELLALAYAQSRRQGREFARLRTGSLTDRVRQILLLLGGASADEVDLELPSLRQLAGILDASPEAICRVLGGMRHLDVLVARQPRRARVVRRALTELVPLEGMSSGVRAMLARPSANREAAC